MLSGVAEDSTASMYGWLNFERRNFDDAKRTRAKKYAAISRLSATLVAAVMSLPGAYCEAIATKFTPPPMYEAVIMAATFARSFTFSNEFFKRKYAMNAPMVVPSAPIKKITRRCPVCDQIFFRLQRRSSIGMAIGTIMPQTTSS